LPRFGGEFFHRSAKPFYHGGRHTKARYSLRRSFPRPEALLLPSGVFALRHLLIRLGGVISGSKFPDATIERQSSHIVQFEASIAHFDFVAMSGIVPTLMKAGR
jgi:hypothetical protein